MEKLQGFPFFRIEFTKQGAVFKPEQRKAILDELPAGTTDLLVLSHGWNNDIADAHTLYNNLLHSMNAEMPAALKTKKFAVVGVFWPSKKFTDAELQPGGGASIGGVKSPVETRLDDLAALLQSDTLPEKATAATDPAIEKAKALVPDIETDDEEAAKKLIDMVRKRVAADTGMPGEDKAGEDSADRAFKDSPEAILANLAVPFESDAGGAPAGGGAAGFGDFLKSIPDRTNDVLNFLTYYTMKERAGEVGQKGVAPLVSDIQAKFPAVRIHLVGHSFGGRVVTAAAANIKKAIASMALLQAAFSHNALGDNTKGLVGFYRKVVTGKLISGPIVITHTHNDKAVGLAYPVASRIANQNASGLGDANDVFGGIGSNGALHAGASTDFKLTKAGKIDALKFQKGKIYNLLADDAVKDHSDVTNPAVARMILAAVGV
jgi:alpha/beta hydrolase fold